MYCLFGAFSGKINCNLTIKSDLYLLYRKEDLITLYYWSCSSELCLCIYCIKISTNQLAYFKVALGVSPQFFFIWTRVLNQNKYVEIKQFSKEDTKQNNISTVILLIKFLVYQYEIRAICKEVGLFTYLFILYIPVLFNI